MTSSAKSAKPLTPVLTACVTAGLVAVNPAFNTLPVPKVLTHQ